MLWLTNVWLNGTLELEQGSLEFLAYRLLMLVVLICVQHQFFQAVLRFQQTVLHLHFLLVEVHTSLFHLTLLVEVQIRLFRMTQQGLYTFLVFTLLLPNKK